MPRNAEQKIKILVLYEILSRYTDEENPMTTTELAERLKEYGISTTRQTIYYDIDLLCRFGYEIVCDSGKNNKYYVADRKFERPEVQILLNAIGAANFLTAKKTDALTRKVAELLALPQGEKLKETVTFGVKRSNERIYYSIEAVTSALLERKRLSFTYFDRTAGGEKVYRKEGERYEVNPLGMICSGDNYYLVCYHDKYGEPTNYRIDRIEDARVEERPIAKRKEFENFDLAAYKRELFAMYAGERTEISLIFPDDLTDVMTDRFGENVKLIGYGDGKHLVNATVRVSKTFYAWLTTFEGRVKIRAPEHVREQFRSFLQNILNNVDT